LQLKCSPRLLAAAKGGKKKKKGGKGKGRQRRGKKGKEERVRGSIKGDSLHQIRGIDALINTMQ